MLNNTELFGILYPCLFCHITFASLDCVILYACVCVCLSQTAHGGNSKAFWIYEHSESRIQVENGGAKCAVSLVLMMTVPGRQGPSCQHSAEKNGWASSSRCHTGPTPPRDEKRSLETLPICTHQAWRQTEHSAKENKYLQMVDKTQCVKSLINSNKPALQQGPSLERIQYYILSRLYESHLHGDFQRHGRRC